MREEEIWESFRDSDGCKSLVEYDGEKKVFYMWVFEKKLACAAEITVHDMEVLRDNLTGFLEDLHRREQE